jgi:prepilin-type N-terminal cleavage/methylation domain-containing protein
MHKEKGFNLIELMIVIAIMASLAAIALPSYSRYLNKGRAIAAVVATEPVRTAIAEYAITHNGDLSAVSNDSLHLSSADLTEGSHDVTRILITTEGAHGVSIVASLSDQLGDLTWQGTYNPQSGNLRWQCTYPAESPLQHYAPQGCEATP